MTVSLELAIMTTAAGHPAGVMEVVCTVPAAWYLTVNGDRGLNTGKARQELQGQTTRLLRRAGRELHHAHWVITADPAVVRARPLIHDCAGCRTSVADAITHLAAHPGDEVALGRLWWAT
jgi:hypothetical protein